MVLFQVCLTINLLNFYSKYDRQWAMTAWEYKASHYSKRLKTTTTLCYAPPPPLSLFSHLTVILFIPTRFITRVSSCSRVWACGDPFPWLWWKERVTASKCGCQQRRRLNWRCSKCGWKALIPLNYKCWGGTKITCSAEVTGVKGLMCNLVCES